ncbi:MAG: hypothetical protein R3F61_26120 [Myxococcota bacterium]
MRVLSVGLLGLAWVAGCGSSDCGPDETITADGCVPRSDGAVWDEDTLPGFKLRPCEIQAGDGELDLIAGCAHGVCAGDDYTTWTSVLGAATECDASGSFVTCRWRADGLFGTFPDQDDDGLADPTGVPLSVAVDDVAGGRTASGVGVDESLACFVQELGTPSDIESNGTERVEALDFDTATLHVHAADLYGQSDFDPDGYVDLILLSPR